MDTLPVGAFHPAKFLVPVFLMCIILRTYRLYQVRVYHRPSWFWNIGKIDNMDNFIKSYTNFSIISLIIFTIAIMIVLFVKMEYITISLFIVALLSAPAGITFYYKLKKS